MASERSPQPLLLPQAGYIFPQPTPNVMTPFHAASLGYTPGIPFIQGTSVAVTAPNYGSMTNAAQPLEVDNRFQSYTYSVGNVIQNASLESSDINEKELKIVVWDELKRLFPEPATETRVEAGLLPDGRAYAQTNHRRENYFIFSSKSHYILYFVHYYFSKDNLERDMKFMEIMIDRTVVPVEKLIQAPRLVAIGTSQQDLEVAVANSKRVCLIELPGGAHGVRRIDGFPGCMMPANGPVTYPQYALTGQLNYDPSLQAAGSPALFPVSLIGQPPTQVITGTPGTTGLPLLANPASVSAHQGYYTLASPPHGVMTPVSLSDTLQVAVSSLTSPNIGSNSAANTNNSAAVAMNTVVVSSSGTVTSSGSRPNTLPAWSQHQAGGVPGGMYPGGGGGGGGGAAGQGPGGQLAHMTHTPQHAFATKIAQGGFAASHQQFHLHHAPAGTSHGVVGPYAGAPPAPPQLLQHAGAHPHHLLSFTGHPVSASGHLPAHLIHSLTQQPPPQAGQPGGHQHGHHQHQQPQHQASTTTAVAAAAAAAASQSTATQLSAMVAAMAAMTVAQQQPQPPLYQQAHAGQLAGPPHHHQAPPQQQPPTPGQHALLTALQQNHHAATAAIYHAVQQQQHHHHQQSSLLAAQTTPSHLTPQPTGISYYAGIPPPPPQQSLGQSHPHHRSGGGGLPGPHGLHGSHASQQHGGHTHHGQVHHAHQQHNPHHPGSHHHGHTMAAQQHHAPAAEAAPSSGYSAPSPSTSAATPSWDTSQVGVASVPLPASFPPSAGLQTPTSGSSASSTTSSLPVGPATANTASSNSVTPGSQTPVLGRMATPSSQSVTATSTVSAGPANAPLPPLSAGSSGVNTAHQGASSSSTGYSSGGSSCNNVTSSVTGTTVPSTASSVPASPSAGSGPAISHYNGAKGSGRNSTGGGNTNGGGAGVKQHFRDRKGAEKREVTAFAGAGVEAEAEQTQAPGSPSASGTPPPSQPPPLKASIVAERTQKQLNRTSVSSSGKHSPAMANREADDAFFDHAKPTSTAVMTTSLETSKRLRSHPRTSVDSEDSLASSSDVVNNNAIAKDAGDPPLPTKGRKGGAVGVAAVRLKSTRLVSPGPEEASVVVTAPISDNLKKAPVGQDESLGKRTETMPASSSPVVSPKSSPIAATTH